MTSHNLYSLKQPIQYEVCMVPHGVRISQIKLWALTVIQP